MPHIHGNISRKQFIKRSSLAAGAAFLGMRGNAQDAAGAAGPVAANSGGKAMHLAILSDTHIPADASDTYRGFNMVNNLRSIIPGVIEAKPEAAVVIGDLARSEGLRADYEAFRGLIAPAAEQMPFFLTMGNHDDRSQFRGVFPETPEGFQKGAGKNVVVVEHEEVRLIVLDSLLYVDKVAGLLGKRQRDWLASCLKKADDKVTVLFIHHTLGDNDGDLLDVDRLFNVLQSHKNVKAIFYGHSHQYKVTERAGVKLINVPAVAYNFNDREPIGWLDARLSATGAALTLRAIDGNLKGNNETRKIVWV